ncbi:MAG: hypothetical protein ACP5NC_07535 [Nitrososphaeria archaeon]
MINYFFNQKKKNESELSPDFVAKAMLAQLIKYLYIDRNFDVANPRLSEKKISWVDTALESINEFDEKLKMYAGRGVTINLVNSEPTVLKCTINKDLEVTLVNYLKWLLAMPPKRSLLGTNYIRLGDMDVPRQSSILESLINDRFYTMKLRFDELDAYVKSRPAYLIVLSRIAARGNNLLDKKVNIMEENLIKNAKTTAQEIERREKEISRYISLGLIF